MGAKWTLKYGLIAVFVTSVLLAVVGMSIYYLQMQENERIAKEEAIAHLSTQAHQLAEGARMRLQQLEMIAHTDTMRLGTNATRLAYLEREIDRLNRQFYRIGFTDRNGTMYVTGGQVIDASKQPGYSEAMSGLSVLTPPIADSLNPNVHLVLARVPYHNTGEKPVGIISGSIRLADLFAEYYTFQFDRPQKLYFIDDNNTAYAVMERGIIARTEDLPMELVAGITNRPHGMASIKLGLGRHHVIYVEVEGTSWHMAIAVPDRELFAGRGELKLRLTVIFAALEAVLLAVILIYNRGFVRKMRFLSRRLARMSHKARHDSLTELPNRMYLMESVEALIAQHPRTPDKLIALALFDLDRFKLINDTLGHHVGDRCLVHVAHAVSRELQPGQTLYRLGGDEFVLLLEGLDSIEQGIAETRRIMTVLEEPFRVMNHEFQATGSTGISFYPSHAADGNGLLQCSDIAMYQAKRGGTGIELYDSALAAQTNRRLLIEQQLRRAIQQQELYLVYQPIEPMTVGDRQGTGVEALLRWESRELGAIGPDGFIPIAEETGIILEIGDWVLREACRQLCAWQAEGLPVRSVSVNISAIQLAQPSFTDRVRSVLDQSGCDPEAIIFEVTESAVIRDIGRVSATLGELARMGIVIALDDFGTGYSSLSVLHQLEIDRLKIDRSFIARMSREGKEASLVHTMIAIASQLGLDVVAEGVESEEQLLILRELGCSLAQGYWFSKPFRPEELRSYLEAGRRTV
jgi:diguanylate cyclase (GGDEF)-like protein